MSGITVWPVRSAREKHIFLTFPWRVYRHDPFWVPPLLPDRKKILDPQTGPFFKHGRSDCFIAWQNGQPVGTIMAAEDFEQNQARGQKNCVIGFFEAVNDMQVAYALFNQARQWAADHGLDCLYGPFNLDYEDAYGVLIEGWDQPAALLCGHNPPYYQQFFENYGFVPARGDNLAFSLSLGSTPQINQLARMAQRAKAANRFTIRNANFAQWQDEIDVIYPMINAALAHLPDHRPWMRDELENLFRPFLQIADPDLILFIEENGKPVGFFPGVPNMNEVLIHANGLRFPWDYFGLWLHAQRKPKGLSIKSVLVYPEYWGSGAAVLLFDEMARRAQDKGYTWLDLSLTSADNPRTPALAQRFGAKIYKRYRVYRKPI